MTITTARLIRLAGVAGILAGTTFISVQIQANKMGVFGRR